MSRNRVKFNQDKIICSNISLLSSLQFYLFDCTLLARFFIDDVGCLKLKLACTYSDHAETLALACCVLLIATLV